MNSADASTVPLSRPRFRLTHAESLAAAGLTLAGLYAAMIHATVDVLPFDDAFIAFRYVKNLFGGSGLVYNAGERVFGISTPLQLLWLIGLRAVTGSENIPALAVRGAMVPFIAAGLSVFFLVRRWTGSLFWATLVGAAFLVNQSLIAISTGGMEPFLFIALAFFSILAMSNGRPIAAGVLGGLAYLARPEGLILFPLAVLAFASSRRNLLLMTAAFAIPVLAWMAFVWGYYGSIIPQSVIAKSKPIYNLDPGSTLQFVYQFITDNIFGGRFSRGMNWGPFVLVSAAIAGMVSGLAPQGRRTLAYMPAVLLLWIVALYNYANPLFFEWYWPPIYATALVSIIAGIGTLATAAGSHPRLQQVPRPIRLRVRGVLELIAIVWLLLTTFRTSGYGYTPLASAYDVQADGARLRSQGYRTAADLLHQAVAPGEVVAAPEIGAIGYYYNGKILDACGLVSPEAMEFLPIPREQQINPLYGAITAGLVEKHQPAWIVSMEVFARHSVLASPWFAEHYTLWRVVKLPKSVWGTDQLLIFRRAK